MFVLKKLYSDNSTGDNKEVLTQEQAIRTVHALTNLEFYQRIHNYIGWTVIYATYSIPDFVIIEEATILVAHYDLNKTVRSIQFTPIGEYFDSKIETIVGDTIRAIGTIDSPGIKDSKRYEAKDYSNKVTKPVDLDLKEFEYVSPQTTAFNAALRAKLATLPPFDPTHKFAKPINIPQELLDLVTPNKSN
jgi:hypothetical protein